MISFEHPRLPSSSSYGMAAKSPPKATKILATPICDVEESRAQRLQRQQSRFRDRGGIFVPSSRNILADILLGKASPIKKPRRSASLSSSKGRRKLATEKSESLVRATSVHQENPRKSPRKRRDSSVASGPEGPKPFSRVSSHSGSKSLGDSRKASSEAATRKFSTNTSNDDDNPALVKEPSAKKRPASRRPTKSKSSKTKAQKSSKVAKPPETHDDASRSKKNRPNAAISSADPMDGHVSEPHETVSLVPAPSNASSSAKPSRSKRNIPIDGASKSRKKSATNKSSTSRKSSSKSSVPSKSSKSKAGASQLPDIMEEDEDEVLSPSPKISSLGDECPKIRYEATARKKRPVTTDPDVRPLKRAKPAPEATTMNTNKTKKTPKPQFTSDEEPSPVQRKRRRAVEQDEDADMDGKVDKPAKRKKVVEDKSPLKVKKDVVKPPGSMSAPKAQAHSKSVAKKPPTKTAKRKENSAALDSAQMEKPQAPIRPRRGLPKSVLLRIMNSSAAHVVDDEPDPIDFLS